MAPQSRVPEPPDEIDEILRREMTNNAWLIGKIAMHSHGGVLHKQFTAIYMCFFCGLIDISIYYPFGKLT